MKITEEDIYKLIESIFKQNRKSLNRKTPFETFAKDSMDVMEFIAVLENKYHVKIDPAEIIKLKNIGQIIEYSKRNQKETNTLGN